MPTISLRLTDAELAELREWAHDGRRSLQKEIIWRLFTIEGGQAPKVAPATGEQGMEITVPVDGQMVERPKHGCPMIVPAGTKCKACGKVHTR